MAKYINLTPRWSELFGTWQMIVNDAVKVKKPDQMERFWSQVETAFKAADRYNDLITYLRKSDTLNWDDDMFARATDIGRSLNEEARTTVHEEGECCTRDKQLHQLACEAYKQADQARSRWLSGPINDNQSRETAINNLMDVVSNLAMVVSNMTAED